jgi:hypothetical protein
VKPLVASLTAAERETVINMDDATDSVRIWSAQRSVIGALRRKPNHFTEVGSGFHGSTEWAAFSTVSDRWSLATGAKRKGTPRPNLRGLEDSSLTGLAKAGRHSSAVGGE